MSWLSSLLSGAGRPLSAQPSFDFCVRQVRQFDHEHFFCGSLITSQPPSKNRSQQQSPPPDLSQPPKESACCPTRSGRGQPLEGEGEGDGEAAFSAVFPKEPYNTTVIQKTYWAVRALNIETALACESAGDRVNIDPVSEVDSTTIGPLARLYWWKQTLQGLYRQRTAQQDKRQAAQDPTFLDRKEARFHKKVLRGELLPHEFEENDPTRPPAEGSVPTQHPVVDALSQCIVDPNIPVTTSLSRMWFIRHVDARIREVEMAHSNQIRHINDFETLCEHAHSSLIYLTLESLGFKAHPHAEHAASHVGKALGIVSILRGLPHHWQRRRLFLPLEVCQHYKLVPEKVFQHASQSGKDQKQRTVALPEAQDVVFQLSCHAKEHIRHAREVLQLVPKEAIPAFLPLLLVENILEKLLAVQFDVYHPNLARRSPFLPLRLWRAAKTGQL